MTINLITNQKGLIFYKKWVKETRNGIIIYTPLFLFFYLGMGILIYGFSLKYILISIFPVVLILISFVRPYYSRKRYFNQLARGISLNNNFVSIETYKWFSSDPIVGSISINNISICEINDISLFKGMKVHTINLNAGNEGDIYIVEDFFDGMESVLTHLYKKA